MHSTLQSVLVLLAAAVVVVAVLRSARLPTLLGYLVVGIAVGPHALGWIPDTAEARLLAEVGVAFFMFTIGLEFSLPRLVAMRRIVFGLGSAQVLATGALVGAGASAFGLAWQPALVLGGVVAMSSTAIVGKLLAERLELGSVHGRQIVGILLFQDLAVVPLLILIPALAPGGADPTAELASALVKAAVLLALMLFAGQRLMRAWFHLIARLRSGELFVINVLLIALGLSYLTELAGLSFALGAFLAGALIAETEYRHQVETDIRPFRDVLLGLFFVTLGMLLDMRVIAAHAVWVAAGVVALLALKAAVLVAVVAASGAGAGNALRTALALAACGEFGFVLLQRAGGLGLIEPELVQATTATMLLSMIAAPLLIHRSEDIVRWWVAGEWTARATELTRIAAQAMGAQQHVLICGFGRSGQNLARLLRRESIPFIALDVDPQRIREAAAAGESVVFGDASRREVLVAAGIARARLLAVTFADTASALRILHHARELRPALPVIVRTLDDSDIDRLREAGAAEVVAEVMEGSLMLASTAFLLLGVPLARVMQHLREARENRYHLFRGFFRGVTDESGELEEADQPRLRSVTLTAGARAIGKPLAELGLESLGVEVTALRRRGAPAFVPEPATRVEEGDVLVLLGAEPDLAAAEIRLLQG